ncbi:hypothetical protein F4V43_01740 [Paenibacillus spiritus]|uniref:DUF2726 domain-containing protein n=1 Tax=Paenibacillus spiritus TaxID=2496557 RepID=A0A5J5GI97_9BACL|nr:hypothetical protein [Paenibacillus spiritus]KAA9007234.1 hypothetical protein F4V43_01740 [Paenibacillus spiritus]
MSKPALTDEDFKIKVFNLVGDEYVFLEKYKKAKEKIKVMHNKCGHKYDVAPTNFYGGKRCPKCFGGIKRTNSEFLNEIKRLTSDEYIFLEDYINNHTSLKVIHGKCGNEYKVSPSAFINGGQRCPICAIEKRKVIMSEAKFLEDIHELVGNEYTFLERYRGSRNKIKIKHNVCGNIYEVSPQRFKSGNRCKKCNDDITRKSKTDFVREVFDEVEDEYIFLDEYVNAKTKLRVKHIKCSGVFSTTPNNFLRGNRCPKCSVSKGEEKISKYLNKKGIVFEREVTFPDLKIASFLRYDFGLYGSDNKLKALIEYDGKHHFEQIEFWGGEEGFKKVLERDKIKNNYAISNGIPLTRISYREYRSIDKILDNALKDLSLNTYRDGD